MVLKEEEALLNGEGVTDQRERKPEKLEERALSSSSAAAAASRVDWKWCLVSSLAALAAGIYLGRRSASSGDEAAGLLLPTEDASAGDLEVDLPSPGILFVSPSPAAAVRTRPVLEPEKHPAGDAVRGLRPGAPPPPPDWPPGHMGLGLEVREDSLPPEQLERKEAMWRRHAFQEFVSDLIPLDRRLPDWRDPWCRRNYPPGEPGLPETSVIICFHNEAWSTLLRSIHSVFDRSPPALLKEVILIDDASELDHLGERLERYLRSEFVGRARLVRLRERQGLMRCRLRGIAEARAEVLTFLDSHVEAGHGWMEPMLHRIKQDRNIIVCPVIDAVNDTTFYYHFVERDLYGLMNWRLEFEWHTLEEEKFLEKVHPWAPIASPVMAGGLFAIHRDRFKELGYYDEGMEIWGGENLELSFKAWLCPPAMEAIEVEGEGGRAAAPAENRIEILPCSRVGHIFRSWSPYDTRPDQIHRNNIRVASVWMDEFKYIYFDRLGQFEVDLATKLGSVGDVSSRLELKESLDCRPFRWFVERVAAPVLPGVEGSLGAGELYNPSTGLCLDKGDRVDMIGSPVDLLHCHNLAGNQYWYLGPAGHLMRDYTCLGVLPSGPHSGRVGIMHCGEVGTWEHRREDLTLRYSLSGRCMAFVPGPGDQDRPSPSPSPSPPPPPPPVLVTRECLGVGEEGQETQQFVFSRYNPGGLSLEELGQPVMSMGAQLQQRRKEEEEEERKMQENVEVEEYPSEEAVEESDDDDDDDDAPEEELFEDSEVVEDDGEVGDE